MQPAISHVRVRVQQIAAKDASTWVPLAITDSLQLQVPVQPPVLLENGRTAHLICVRIATQIA